MDETIKTVLAVWGAVLSTIMALYTLFSSYRDKPKINVKAGLIFLHCNESDLTKGTKVQDTDGIWNEVRLEIEASNSGNKSLQIVSVYIEEEKHTNQIFPEHIPTVLEPRTRLKTFIQKEWLDNSHILDFGLLDALGKRHPIKSIELEKLIAKSNALPSNKRKYKDKETGEIVEAFQVTDEATVNTKVDS